MSRHVMQVALGLLGTLHVLWMVIQALFMGMVLLLGIILFGYLLLIAPIN